jgi:thiol:disulfide interchange protein DsbC
MNQALYALVIALVFVSALGAADIITDEAKFKALKMKNMVLQDPVLSIKGVVEKPRSYILKLEAKSPQGSQFITAFLDKKTSELYIGTAYDKEGNVMMFPQDAKVISDGVAFSYGKGSEEIYIVTDPECVYCSRFEKAVAGKLDDFRVHVILFPLPFHPKAPAMIEWIMQGKDDVEKKARFEEVMLKGSTQYEALIKKQAKHFVYSEPVEAYISKSELATMELNVRGTPAIFNSDFMPVMQDELLEEVK